MTVLGTQGVALGCHIKPFQGSKHDRRWPFPLQTAEELPKGKHSKDKVCLSITWHRRQSWSEWATLSEGCYLLRTNLTESDPATLGKQYIQLTKSPVD